LFKKEHAVVEQRNKTPPLWNKHVCFIKIFTLENNRTVIILLLCWLKGKATSNENATMRSGAHGMGVTVFEDTKTRLSTPPPSPQSKNATKEVIGPVSAAFGIA